MNEMDAIDKLNTSDLQKLCLKCNLMSDIQIKLATDRQLKEQLKKYYREKAELEESSYDEELEKKHDYYAEHQTETYNYGNNYNNNNTNTNQVDMMMMSNLVQNNSLTPSGFLSILSQMDLQEQSILLGQSEPSIYILVNQKNDVKSFMNDIKKIQQQDLLKLVNIVCFDEEDFQVMGNENASVIRGWQQQQQQLVSQNVINPICKLYELQSLLVSALSDMLAVRENNLSNMQLTDTQADFFQQKNIKLQQLLKIQEQKRAFIYDTLVHGFVKHPLFEQARNVLISKKN